MNKKEIGELDLVRLAAFIDGEGSIFIIKQKRKNRFSATYRVGLNVTNTSIKLMDWLKSTFGGNDYIHENPAKKWKTVYEWRSNGIDAYRILSKVEKYLIIKPEQAKIALEFWYETQREQQVGLKKSLWAEKRQEGYYRQMKKLNGKGIVEYEKQIEGLKEKFGELRLI